MNSFMGAIDWVTLIRKDWSRAMPENKLLKGNGGFPPRILDSLTRCFPGLLAKQRAALFDPGGGHHNQVGK